TAAKTSWDPIQVNVGIQGNDGTSNVSIDPSAIALLIDGKAGKGALHVSIPASTLQMDASTLAALGANGSTIDFDGVFDGQALYVRSPLVGQMLTLLLANDIPKGDLSGWLRLGTVAEFQSLVGSLGAGAGSDLPAPSVAGDGSLKSVLDEMGVTLTT